MREHDLNLAIKNIVREYPIPIFTFIGLLSGIIVFITGYRPTAHQIWFLTLVLGGAPIVFHTLRGMLRGQFASDIVATLAIVTAIIMGQ